MPENTIVTTWELAGTQKFLADLQTLRDAVQDTKNEIDKGAIITLKPLDLVSPKIAELHTLAAKPLIMKVQLDPQSVANVKSQIQSLQTGVNIPINVNRNSGSSGSHSYSSSPSKASRVETTSSDPHAGAKWYSHPLAIETGVGAIEGAFAGAGIKAGQSIAHATMPEVAWAARHVGYMGAGAGIAANVGSIAGTVGEGIGAIGGAISGSPILAGAAIGAALPTAAHFVDKALTSQNAYFRLQNIKDYGQAIGGMVSSVARAPVTVPLRAVQGMIGGWNLGQDNMTSDGGSSFAYEHRKAVWEKSNIIEKAAMFAGGAIGGTARVLTGGKHNPIRYRATPGPIGDNALSPETESAIYGPGGHTGFNLRVEAGKQPTASSPSMPYHVFVDNMPATFGGSGGSSPTVSHPGFGLSPINNLNGIGAIPTKSAGNTLDDALVAAGRNKLEAQFTEPYDIKWRAAAKKATSINAMRSQQDVISSGIEEALLSGPRGKLLIGKSGPRVFMPGLPLPHAEYGALENLPSRESMHKSMRKLKFGGSRQDLSAALNSGSIDYSDPGSYGMLSPATEAAYKSGKFGPPPQQNETLKALGETAQKATNSLKDLVSKGISGAEAAFKKVGSTIGNIFGGSGGGESGAAGSQAGNAGGNTPSIGRARGVSGAVRNAALGIGLPAIAGFIATDAIQEILTQRHRKENLGLSYSAAQYQGGRMGIAEQELERRRSELTEGESGIFNNFLYKNEWLPQGTTAGGYRDWHGKSYHQLHLQDVDEQQKKIIEMNRQNDLSNRELGQQGVLSSAIAGRAGQSDMQREISALADERNQKEYARRMQYNADVMQYGEATASKNAAKEASIDTSAIMLKQGRLVELQSFSRKKFNISERSVRESANAALLGDKQFGEMLSLQGSRRSGLADVEKSFGKGSKEAEDYRDNTVLLEKELEKRQAIEKEQNKFNSDLKVAGELQEGNIGKLRAYGQLGLAQNAEILFQEDQKIKVAQQALEIAQKTDVANVQNRKHELEAAQQHKKDLQDIIALESKMFVRKADERTQALAYANSSAATGGIFSTLHDFKARIEQARTPAEAQAIMREQGQTLHNINESRALSNAERSERTYETRLRAGGADRMAELSHINFDAAQSKEKNRAANAQLQQDLKKSNPLDIVGQKAIQDAIIQNQKDSTLIEAQRKADIALTMRNSVSFSSPWEAWHKMQEGGWGKLNKPNIAGLGPPQMPGQGVGNIGGALGGLGNVFGNVGNAVHGAINGVGIDQSKAVTDFKNAVDKWTGALDNAMKIMVVGI